MAIWDVMVSWREPGGARLVTRTIEAPTQKAAQLAAIDETESLRPADQGARAEATLVSGEPEDT